MKHVEALPIDSDMSDHALILFSLEVMRPHAVRKTITFRSYRNVDNNSIVNDIEHILNVLDVSSLTAEDCTIWYNKFFNSLENKFCTLISKEILVKADAPWYDHTVAVLRRQPRRVERGWRRLRSDTSRSDYTAARRAVGNQVLLRKVEFYGGEVASCKGDQKKLCCLMNNLMGLDSPTSLPSSESDTQLALDFSRFFQSKVLRIREELDGTPVHGDYSVEFHPQQSVRSLFLKFNSVAELSIRRYIRELNKTYCSLDPINVSKITVAFEAAAPFIASLVNKYFEECNFVTSEKVALVRPTLKKPGLDVEDMNSFRPVSNISFLSKIVERAMLYQLLPFLEENRIIPKIQSAYRQFHSTETALCKIHNDLVTNACPGKASLLVVLDLLAAFDTVDHDVLLADLFSCGIREDAYSLLKSYLTNRFQRTSVGALLSEPVHLQFGVFQGCVLGPILFTYMSNLATLLEAHNVAYHFYADDTQIYIRIDSIEDVREKLSSLINDIKIWMNGRKLKLNDGKTYYHCQGESKIKCC